jgi:hypothetical protein
MRLRIGLGAGVVLVLLLAAIAVVVGAASHGTTAVAARDPTVRSARVARSI